MSKWTKGPWTYTGSDTTTRSWVEDENGERVCTLRAMDGDMDRGKLIAAAPELVDSLKLICTIFDKLRDGGEISYEKNSPVDKAFREARAILAKVES